MGTKCTISLPPPIHHAITMPKVTPLIYKSECFTLCNKDEVLSPLIKVCTNYPAKRRRLQTQKMEALLPSLEYSSVQ